MSSKLHCPRPIKSNTCAIIVSYHPDPGLEERISYISKQVQNIFVIDNGSTVSEIKVLESISKNNNNVHLILNKENLGISKALNLGVSLAKNNKLDWMLTLEQDSCVSDNMIENMSITYDKCPCKERLALIAPTYSSISPDGDHLSKIDTQGLDCSEKPFKYVKTVVTSGSLVRTEIFPIIGLYDEDLFVDYVDFEFCLRLHRFHYQIIQSTKAILYHQVGFPVIHYFLGIPITVRNHNKFRKYYIARNRILTHRKVFALDYFTVKWIMIDLAKAFVHFLMIIVFESEKKEKASFYIRGIVDGIMNKKEILDTNY